MFTKKERIAAKLDIVNNVFVSLLTLLEESYLHATTLWPKNGFIAGTAPGYNKIGNYRLDTINVKIFADPENNNGRVRFNIWTKTYGRAFKQSRQLILLLNQTVYNKIYFDLLYPDLEHTLMCHDFDEGYVMGMLDVRFTIQ